MRKLICMIAAVVIGLPVSALAQVSNPPDLSGLVRSVSGNTPDNVGAVTLPSTYNGTSCTNCTMAAPTFTGATNDGYPIATTATVASAIAALPVPATTYAGGCTAASPCTVAAVLSSTPCGAAYIGQYAVVSNLYSGASNTNEVMRCGVTGTNYYWRPQRTDFAANIGTSSGSLTVACLVTPPTIFNGANLTGNVTVSMTTTNCWPGARFEYGNNATLNLFGVAVTGLAGSTTKSLGLGARGVFVFDGTAWQSF